jgi:hypothetical protein
MFQTSLRTILIFVGILLMFIAPNFFTYAQNNPVHGVNGIWADSNTTDFTNGYAIFSVDTKGKIAVTHYVEYKGKAMIEKGFGTCTNNTLTYNVMVTKAIPGWATRGKHVLTLSEDGKTLRGYYKDQDGNKGPLVFKRLYQ